MNRIVYSFKIKQNTVGVRPFVKCSTPGLRQIQSPKQCLEAEREMKMHFKSSLYIKTKIDHGHSLLSSTEDRLISHRSWKRFRITCEAVNDRWRVKIGDTCCEKNLLIGWWTWWWSGEEMSWRAKSSSKKPSWKTELKWPSSPVRVKRLKSTWR